MYRISQSAALQQAPTSRAVAAALAIVFAFMLASTASAADPQSDDTAPAGFQSIVDRFAAEAIRAVADYVRTHRDASDVEQAYAWLFATASEQNLEGEVLEIAAEYLQRDDLRADQKNAALRVQAIGYAKTGEMTDALAAFEQHLSSASIREPAESIELGIELVEEAQLAGEFEAVPQIYDLIANKFFLNTEVRRLVDNRRARFELAKEPAPDIGVTDLEGTPVSLTDFEGKVLLVDFWATFCPPCLEQFPEMKQLYSETRDRGFEILGISLDEQPQVITAFAENWKLPWRLAASSTDMEDTQSRYHAVTIPAMFLIDRNGRVAFVDLRGDNLRRAVEKLLDAAPE